MRNSATIPPGTTSRRRNWILLALIAALVVTLLISLVAIGAYFLFNAGDGETVGWRDPVLAVDTTRVRADIGVLPLFVEPAAQIIQEALAAGEPSSAYAILAYAITMSDGERSGNLFLLARALQEADDRDRAALCYQQIHDLASLSPRLSDLERAESSLQAARGLVDLGLLESARPSMAQAEALARYSSLLAPVKRREIAERLLLLYRDAGLEAEANDLAQLIREPQGLPDARLVRGPFIGTFQAPIAKPQQLLDAEQARRRAAQAFLLVYDTGSAADVEAARTDLANSLLLEDGVRQAVVAAELEASTQLSVRAAWQQERVDWLTLKRMIASQATGFVLVPEWELDRSNILAELGDAYRALFATYADQVAALPDTEDVAFARIEVLRTQLLLGRLGLYPQFAEEGLAADLQAAQIAIADRLPLLVVEQPWGGGRVFRLAESFD